MVRNVHTRRFPHPVPPELLAGLGTPDDRLWPVADWPPTRLDGPPVPGTTAGHGPVRYVLEEVEPDRLRFRFTAPKGLHGYHEFTADDGTLTHVLAGTLHGWARLSWPLVFRPLHDALLEQLLDRAELAVTGRVARPVRWSPYVRFLRTLATMRAGRLSPADHA
ncbi:SRPBCC family protein [Amycolatopsis sp., V23-08]|uniref:SRPBCC family protein n=1 Tax=Amycolatopsis heterodermiae TaxID=3110235 RepID=A0ABU5RCR2_9PSEU|nr:SRPBCC family protein [Amycolatopsis sp., V23-08]MEA5363933.1 SRPBCC family protein [Amycolatopsis sp., V23-08]